MKTLPKILVLLVLAAMPIAADDLPVVTLDEAIQSATENNISLQRAALLLNQTVRNQNNYVSTYLPNIGVTAKADTGVSFPTTLSPDTEFDGVGLTLSASASFNYTLNGSRITKGASRRLAKESASLGYETTYDSIEYAITSSYWALASCDIAIENAQAALESAETSYASTKEMYDRGMVDELTMANAELYLTDSRISLMQAQNDKEMALASFKAATGIIEDFQTEPLPETVELSLPSPEELFAVYGEGSVSIRSARNDLATKQNLEKAATLTQYMPVISADIGYVYNGGASTKTKEYSSNANSLSGSISVTVPLSSYIPGSSADASRKDAKDAVMDSSLALQNAQNELLDSIRSSVISINQQQASMSMLESSLATAKRTYALAEQSYDAGLITADDLAEKRTALLSAQNSMLSARVGHLLSCCSLANTLGIDLQELQEAYPLTEKETV